MVTSMAKADALVDRGVLISSRSEGVWDIGKYVAPPHFMCGVDTTHESNWSSPSEPSGVSCIHQARDHGAEMY